MDCLKRWSFSESNGAVRLRRLVIVSACVLCLPCATGSAQLPQEARPSRGQAVTFPGLVEPTLPTSQGASPTTAIQQAAMPAGQVQSVQVPVAELPIADMPSPATPKAATSEPELPDGHMNLAMTTWGGTQFWTDHRWWYGWRLQKNHVTGHWRLLDLHDVRRAWGSREACVAELDRRAAIVETPSEATSSAITGVTTATATATDAMLAEPQTIVVLVHGLMRSTDSMEPLAEAITKKGQQQPALFGYASTRASVDDHAAALREWIETLPGKPRLSFVGHSLGNIVVRRAIGLFQQDGDPQQVLPRLHRVVMLGPPNQGATIAKRLSGLRLFETITGNSGLELGASWDNLQGKLATPPCPFCIVAGDVSQQRVQNPLVSGVSDFVVTVEETRLDGAAEHITVPVLHSFLPSDPRSMEIALRFLSQ